MTVSEDMAGTLEIVAVSTGLSEDSTTTRLAARMLAAARESLTARGVRAATTHVNVRSIARQLVDLTVSGLPAPELEEAFAAVRRASAVVTVAPVYKAAPAGIHTLFWQLLDDASLAGTPVLIGTTGGTPRHSLAAESTLRPLIAYLKGYALPTSVFAATDDWGGAGDQDPAGGPAASSGLRARIADAAEELAELTVALHPGAAAAGSDVRPYAGPAEESGRGAIAPARPGRAASARVDRLRDELDPESVTPFAQLLGR